MPRLTPSVSPKSSALTISVRPGRSLMTPAGSRLAHHPPEVEADRFLELGTRTRAGLGVLELVDVDGERHTLALHAVELGSEPTALVGLGEHELRPREASVVLCDLLDRLRDQALDGLLLGRRHGGEGGGQMDLGHGSV